MKTLEDRDLQTRKELVSRVVSSSVICKSVRLRERFLYLCNRVLDESIDGAALEFLHDEPSKSQLRSQMKGASLSRYVTIVMSRSPQPITLHDAQTVRVP
jgi:hypothetical protein